LGIEIDQHKAVLWLSDATIGGYFTISILTAAAERYTVYIMQRIRRSRGVSLRTTTQ